MQIPTLQEILYDVVYLRQRFRQDLISTSGDAFPEPTPHANGASDQNADNDIVSGIILSTS